MQMGELMKCDAVYPDQPFWRDAGLNGFGISDTGAVRAAFDNTPSAGTRRAGSCSRSSAVAPGATTG